MRVLREIGRKWTQIFVLKSFRSTRLRAWKSVKSSTIPFCLSESWRHSRAAIYLGLGKYLDRVCSKWSGLRVIHCLKQLTARKTSTLSLYSNISLSNSWYMDRNCAQAQKSGKWNEIMICFREFRSLRQTILSETQTGCFGQIGTQLH